MSAPVGDFVLVPDGGEARLAVLNVARDVDELVSLADVLVKGRLVLRVSQAVAGLPGILGRRDDNALGLGHRCGRDEASEGRDQGNCPADIRKGENCCSDGLDQLMVLRT